MSTIWYEELFLCLKKFYDMMMCLNMIHIPTVPVMARVKRRKRRMRIVIMVHVRYLCVCDPLRKSSVNRRGRQFRTSLRIERRWGA